MAIPTKPRQRRLTPHSLLAQELDACMPGMDGDAQLNFSSLVDERRAPVSILYHVFAHTHILYNLTHRTTAQTDIH
jgi:hypothetical protein